MSKCVECQVQAHACSSSITLPIIGRPNVRKGHHAQSHPVGGIRGMCWLGIITPLIFHRFDWLFNKLGSVEHLHVYLKIGILNDGLIFSPSVLPHFVVSRVIHKVCSYGELFTWRATLFTGGGGVCVCVKLKRYQHMTVLQSRHTEESAPLSSIGIWI